MADTTAIHTSFGRVAAQQGNRAQAPQDQRIEGVARRLQGQSAPYSFSFFEKIKFLIKSFSEQGKKEYQFYTLCKKITQAVAPNEAKQSSFDLMEFVYRENRHSNVQPRDTQTDVEFNEVRNVLTSLPLSIRRAEEASKGLIASYVQHHVFSQGSLDADKFRAFLLHFEMHIQELAGGDDEEACFRTGNACIELLCTFTDIFPVAQTTEAVLQLEREQGDTPQLEVACLLCERIKHVCLAAWLGVEPEVVFAQIAQEISRSYK